MVYGDVCVARYERNTALKKALLLTFIASSVATSAFAQAGTRDAHEQACGRDVSRFCKAVVNSGDMVVLSCLQQNRTKISRTCQKLLRDNGV